MRRMGVFSKKRSAHNMFPTKQDIETLKNELSNGASRPGAVPQNPRPARKVAEEGLRSSTPSNGRATANGRFHEDLDVSAEPLVDETLSDFPPESKPRVNPSSPATIVPATSTALPNNRERINPISRPRTPASPTVEHEDPLLYSDEESAPAPPDFTRRGIHIPTRTSSSSKPTKFKQRLQTLSRRNTAESASSLSLDNQDQGSTADSVISYETNTTLSLPPLQAKGADGMDRLEPVLEDDPKCFDLVDADQETANRSYSLEKRSDQMFSESHLEAIFQDPALLMRFTSFLSANRPSSVPLLIYYLDALKALRAINYANAVAEALEPLAGGFAFTEHPARPTVNSVLEEKASKAFALLTSEDLPAYIAHVFIQVVSVSIQRRITGTLAPHLREASEGLAEVFCLTDPSRKDNPIIFASEEFHRTTQYGVSYAIGRNCRFLQGPKTSTDSIRRLRAALAAGKETSELFLNYRRDGSPFMNLLMMAPLHDSRGNLRYFIGAQVDVSGLVKECTDLEALQRVIAKEDDAMIDGDRLPTVEEPPKDEFQELTEMFNIAELDTVRRFGGRMHRQQLDEQDEIPSLSNRPRIMLRDTSAEKVMLNEANVRLNNEQLKGKLEGVYQNYVLVRPYPSLRILFTSPSLRVPGLLQTPFLDRISGSARVKESLTTALAEGRGVTAKVRWVANPRQEEEGRARWIHCTPLLGANGSVGVWMVVVVDDESDSAASSQSRRFRAAPPVAKDIRTEHGASHGDRYFGRERDIIDAGGYPGGASDDGIDEYSARHHAKHRPIHVEGGRSSLPTGVNTTHRAGIPSRPQSALSRRGVGTPVGGSSINSFAL